MGSTGSKTEPPTGQTTSLSDVDKTKAEAGEKPKCKPCCACPETRKARDMCIAERGEENCTELIEAHKECMRKLGYKLA